MRFRAIRWAILTMFLLIFFLAALTALAETEPQRDLWGTNTRPVPGEPPNTAPQWRDPYADCMRNCARGTGTGDDCDKRCRGKRSATQSTGNNNRTRPAPNSIEDLKRRGIIHPGKWN